ncbi:hypothetical protein PHLGIDRAFT_28417 [Phlebiopsis gigantea 11061_1 CR5-6]|uniref:Nuclear segregation protein Bfr1 n=1 Tax=Phlebiopsis gigantea (strain 11061_1 CR5-6) TaxID=745531 RepID=A0A0C3SEL9_PHLG1|nr:hypothetical protein PHLGIDRAFT_28417 [Phlebiopsis gigantea 11061_1 CR5-6]
MASTKNKQTNGAGKKSKVSSPSTGTSTPATAASATASSTHIELTVYGSGRPEKPTYDAEQNKIKAEIDVLQTRLNSVKDKLSGGRGGPAQERRKQLLDELAEIRTSQGNIKQSRSKVFDQLKALQDGVQKKIKDLNAAKAKLTYKSVQDVDDRIRSLDQQVESGTMKMADEKRALAEISQLKRSRRTVEGFQREQESIEADRAAADELRKQLDDPESKAMSEKYDAIQAELDELKKAADQTHEARNKLQDERTELQAQLDTLYNLKRESASRFREANDTFYQKLQEDRARRAERARAQREADEQAKKKDIADRLREEAEAPAFQAQIEDCQTLIDYFSGKTSAPAALSTEKQQKTNVVGVPELDIRKVEAPTEGVVVRKKKGEDEQAYFVGGKGKKGKKGGKPAAAPAPAAEPAEAPSGDKLHVPLTTLSALLSLSIPPPTSGADVPRLVEDLKTKKAWFEANQARVTAENKAKAEKEIERLIGKANKVDVPATDDVTPPNGGGEVPAEPAPTPAVADEVSVPVSEDEVVEKLEAVEENGTAEVAEES